MAKATPASKKIVVHLGNKNVKFEVVKHKKVYTAYDLAQTMRTKLDDVAKTLLVKAELPGLKKTDARHYVVVVPASYYVDLGKLKKALGAKKIELVFEKGMKKLGIEPGALTPFGSLHGFGVVVDKAMLKTKDALVGAESFTEHLRMKMKDFVKAETPLVATFGKKNKMKLQVSMKLKKPAKKKLAKKVAKKKRA
jgi:prolyl-tRNA editing enzyme YbaK/EbsC (Cys-tRNA(Pro) deacylase)